MFFWLEKYSEHWLFKNKSCWAFYRAIKDSLKVSHRCFSGVLTAAHTLFHYFHWGGSKSFSSILSWWAQRKHTQLLIAQMQIIPGQFLFCLYFLPSWSHPFLGCQIAALCPWPITLHLCSPCLISVSMLFFFLLPRGINPAFQIPK